MAETAAPIGKVTHFYSNLSVAIILLEDTLSVGDTIHFKGHTTDFTEKVKEIEDNHKSVDTAKKGQEVGVKVSNKVRDGDVVYRV